MSPKSRSERALSIKKIFKRGPQAQTAVVTQRGINADGDVVGIQESPESVELAQLREQVLRGWQHEYDRGYLDGLTRAWNLVENAEGRPGKRQIADMLQEEIKRAEGRDDG